MQRTAKGPMWLWLQGQEPGQVGRRTRRSWQLLWRLRESLPDMGQHRTFPGMSCLE